MDLVCAVEQLFEGRNIYDIRQYIRNSRGWMNLLVLGVLFG